MATSEVNYATDYGVNISCQHSCNWTSRYPNYQLLWELQTFNHQLGTFELHDNASQKMAKDELNVHFMMTSNDDCESGSDWNTFSLHIVGMSDLLQHAVVSCGVRVDQNSPQVYSNKDTYIIINETGMKLLTRCLTSGNYSNLD